MKACQRLYPAHSLATTFVKWWQITCIFQWQYFNYLRFPQTPINTTLKDYYSLFSYNENWQMCMQVLRYFIALLILNYRLILYISLIRAHVICNNTLIKLCWVVPLLSNKCGYLCFRSRVCISFPRSSSWRRSLMTNFSVTALTMAGKSVTSKSNSKTPNQK